MLFACPITLDGAVQPSTPDAMAPESSAQQQRAPIERPKFAQLYADCFECVWSCTRRMGVADESVDDVVQEVFIVAYKKLPSFEGRSSVRSWLLGITVRCVQRYRRTTRRKSPHLLVREPPMDPETLRSGSGDPQELASRAEAARIVRAILDELDDDRRAVFVLSELERLTAPEIAEVLGVPVNTIYSRLRLARQAFAEASARFRREARGSQP
jgi:RNA polymerase sigma-70 factor (ECF subfamily)